MKKSKKLLVVVALIAALLCLACPAAFASTSVDIYLDNELIATYDTDDLEDFDCYYYDYSSYYCQHGGSYRYFEAYGPLLEEVLNDALYDEGKDVDDIDTIEFKDGTWTTETVSLSTVLDGYYYPIPGGTAYDVPAIIALQFGEDEDPLSTTDCLRNFHGQLLGGWAQDTMQDWCKDLDAIYLVSD